MEYNTPAKVKKSFLRLEPWPLAIVLFFLVVFVVNAVFISLSMRTWTGLVTDGAYVKGLAFNQVLHAQHQQDALGWQIKLDSTGLSVGQEGELIVTISDRNGQPISKAEVKGLLFRPIQQAMDRSFVMSGQQPGQYKATVLIPLPGQWDVKLQAVVGSDSYRYVHRIHLPAVVKGG